VRLLFAFAPAVLFGVVFGITFGPGAGIITAALLGLAGWDASDDGMRQRDKAYQDAEKS